MKAKDGNMLRSTGKKASKTIPNDVKMVPGSPTAKAVAGKLSGLKAKPTMKPMSSSKNTLSSMKYKK